MVILGLSPCIWISTIVLESTGFGGQLGRINLLCRQCDIIFYDETRFIANLFDVQYGRLSHHISVALALYGK